MSLAIHPDLAKSLSEKSVRELVAILENPDDWKPEVIDFARMELGRRSIKVDQVLAEAMKQKAEEAQKRATVPLTFRESFFAALYGVGLGLLGLVLQWSAASRFQSNGYILKHQKSWQLYWFFIAVRLIALVIFVCVAFPHTPVQKHQEIILIPPQNQPNGPTP